MTENTWHEPLATIVARRLKAEIKARVGLTASAGVAPNKFLAKIASGWQKPDGLTVIAPERVERFLQGLAVDALWGWDRLRPGSSRPSASDGSSTSARPTPAGSDWRSAARPSGFASSPRDTTPVRSSPTARESRSAPNGRSRKT